MNLEYLHEEQLYSLDRLGPLPMHMLLFLLRELAEVDLCT